MATKIKHTLRPDDGQQFHPSQFNHIGETINVYLGEQRFDVVLRDAKCAADGSSVDLEFYKGDIDALALAIARPGRDSVRIVWPNPERSAAHPPTVSVGQWAIVLGVAATMLGGFWLLAATN